MNKFELFCLIYFALDSEWDKTQNEELGNYLSDANPFFVCGYRFCRQRLLHFVL